jgi:hypothetical protein
VPVLEKPHLLDAPPTVAWNRHLDRYLMVLGHVPEGATGKRGVGFYEARQPWGPWYRIKEQDQFAEGTIFFFQLPPKWMQADGTAWMGFTGPDKDGGEEWDALDIVRVRFVKAGGAGLPVYLGCFADMGGPVVNLSDYDLNGKFFGNNSMTTDLCTSECQRSGFTYAGARHGQNCFCGNSYGKFGTATSCNFSCAGDNSKICGGAGVNSVYRVR